MFFRNLYLLVAAVCSALCFAACSGGNTLVPSSGISGTELSRSRPRPTASPPSAVSLSSWNTWVPVNNEQFYGNAWEARQASINGSQLTITLNNVGCPAACDGLPFASAELHTSAAYGYGLYQIDMQSAPAASGTDTAFFTYADPTGQGLEDEIDVELLSENLTQISTNFYHHGKEGVQKIVDLGFDSSLAIHRYGINWTPAAIQWFVDGKLIATDSSAQYALPTTPPQLYVNLWTAGNSGTWFGPFNYVSPINAYYGNPSFTPYNG
jgi:endo-1,3-1,4-beta-glycanase ExoK